MEGESHHGARNGCTSCDRNLSARARNCIDSVRLSMRPANCVSFGQSLSSQSPKIGKSDSAKAIQTADGDLIRASKTGSAIANISPKKYAHRALPNLQQKSANKSKKKKTRPPRQTNIKKVASKKKKKRGGPLFFLWMLWGSRLAFFFWLNFR